MTKRKINIYYETVKKYTKCVIARSSSDEAISILGYRLLRYARNDATDGIFLQSHYIRALLLAVIGFFISTSISFAATVIPVPFTSQAPLGNWAQPWQDFCEEASVVMAAHFVQGSILTPQRAEAEMQIIKQYERIVFKKYKDTSAEETAGILTDLFGLQHIRVRNITTVLDIKEELHRGNIIIAPVAGRLLKNPYFTPPGPFYHMLIIRGFDDSRRMFITNDPGTRRGNGFAYNQELLVHAIHDFNKGNVLNGEKKIIVVGR